MRNLVNIVLLEDVSNFGQKNELKAVKLGYAKNWLIPQRLAILATKSKVAEYESKKTGMAEKKEQAKKGYEALVQKIELLNLVLKPRKTTKGTLYAAIDAKKIIALLKKEGIALSESFITLEKPIKQVGEYKLPIVFSDDLTATLKITIQ